MAVCSGQIEHLWRLKKGPLLPGLASGAIGNIGISSSRLVIDSAANHNTRITRGFSL
jgi:hypothetical protein